MCRISLYTFELHKLWRLNINEITFKDKEFSETIIKNYEYEITSNNEFVFGYGYIGITDHLQKTIEIKELNQNNKISFEATTTLTKEYITKNKMNLKFKFLTEDDEIITKELILELKEIN